MCSDQAFMSNLMSGVFNVQCVPDTGQF